VRALFTASSLLKGEPVPERQRRRATTALTAAGSAWSSEEDQRVCAEYDGGMTIAQIALQHGRSSGAITTRLVKLGRIDPATVKSRDRGASLVS